MQKLKKAPKKSVMPRANQPASPAKTSSKADKALVKPTGKVVAKSLAVSLAAKKAPVMKKKSQPIVITKKNVPAKPGMKTAAKPVAGKKALAKPAAGKHGAPAKPHAEKHPAKPIKAAGGAKHETKIEHAKAEQKKKVPLHAQEKVAAKPQAKHPIKPAAAKKVEAAPAVKVEKKEAAPAIEVKAKKAEIVVETPQPEAEVILTDAEGRRYCRVKDCDQAATVDGGYCRYHYLLFWKNIQSRRKILSEGKLERYIEELTARYPDKYLELLRKDLRSEKDFLAAIQELEIDDSGVDNEFEDEAQSYLDEVRGMSSESSSEREEEF